MENKNVGYIILGISFVLVLIIFLFNSALKDIVSSSCSLAHGDSISCPMYDTITKQTYLALGIVGILVLIGIVMIFSKPQIKETVVIKKVKEKIKKKEIDLSDLNQNEKEAVKLLQEHGGMFQADLMEKLNIGKVGLTRMLDKLEAKQIIERKRRGMNNFVVIKD